MAPRLDQLSNNPLAGFFGARSEEGEVYYVVHPLDDEPEEKCDLATLGPMKLSRIQRAVLIGLQGYIIVLAGLAVYRVIDIAGLLHYIAR
jgi:hypothetical protein